MRRHAAGYDRSEHMLTHRQDLSGNETYQTEMGKVPDTFEMLSQLIAGVHLAMETPGTNLIRGPSEHIYRYQIGSES